MSSKWPLLLAWFVSAAILLPDVHTFRIPEETMRSDLFFGSEKSLVLVPDGPEIRVRRSLFSSSSNTNDDADLEDEPKRYRRLAHSVHIQSDIRFRYATTLITSRVENPESKPREVFLTVILPETAFISRFAIEIGDQLFVAFVKEKESALHEYQTAVSKGQTAGHVAISARHSNQFQVSVNTEAKASVTFFLLYEELLQRKGGNYEHVVNITPRQKLRDFTVDIYVTENRNLSFIDVPTLRRHEVSLDNSLAQLEDATIRQPSANHAIVRYRPNVQKLQNLLRSKYALQFAMRYDVEHSEKGGEIQVLDGYFVHFLAPEDLVPMPKHVVFVLDTSGSMQGKKMLQTQNALSTILSELRPDDFMSIINFSDDVFVWNHGGEGDIVKATEKNVNTAIGYIRSLEANGGTNIYQALIRAIETIRLAKFKTEQTIIFFLTDGHATTGLTDNQQILSNIRSANAKANASAIFSLAFGRQADFDMLRVLSLQNFAFARKIYIAADASLQLEGFYKEVSNPILKNVTFSYETDHVVSESLTSTNFHTFYQGSEMVVAGHLTKQSDKNKEDFVVKYEIMGTQAGGKYSINGKFDKMESQKAQFYPQTIMETVVFDAFPEVRVTRPNFLERLWAYLTIQDLLRRIARGQMSSCHGGYRGKIRPSKGPKTSALTSAAVMGDDQLLSDEVQGPRVSEWRKSDFERMMEKIGDSDVIICDNLERALFMSLKYEFVTPLTSLVVVKPSSKERGDIGETDDNVKIFSRASSPLSISSSLLFFFLLFIGQFILNSSP